MLCDNKLTINEFKRLLLTEEAHVRIKPRKSSTPPNEASRKTYTRFFNFDHFVIDVTRDLLCFVLGEKLAATEFRRLL